MRRLRCASLVCVPGRAPRAATNHRARFKGLSHDEMLVFQLIQQSGNMGASKPFARRVGACGAEASRRCCRHLDERPEDPQQPAAAAGASRASFDRALLALTTPREQINKCLKALEQRKLIKAVKSVASSNRKVYMLFELEPSREITGGAWCVHRAALLHLPCNGS